MEKRVSDLPPQRRGVLGIYGIRNKEAGLSEVRGAWGKVIGKRCSHHCPAGVTRLQASLHIQKITKQILVHAQLEGRWSHPILSSSAQLDTADSKFLENTSVKHLS